MDIHHLPVNEADIFQFFSPVEITWKDDMNDRQDHQQIPGYLKMNNHAFVIKNNFTKGFIDFTWAVISPACSILLSHVLFE